MSVLFRNVDDDGEDFRSPSFIPSSDLLYRTHDKSLVEAKRKAREFIDGIGPYYGKVLEEGILGHLSDTTIQPEATSDDEYQSLQRAIRTWIEERIRESFAQWLRDPLESKIPSKEDLLNKLSKINSICVYTDDDEKYRVTLGEEKNSDTPLAKTPIAKSLRGVLQMHIASVVEVAKQYHEHRIVSDDLTTTLSNKEVREDKNIIQYGENQTFVEWDLDEDLCGHLAIKRENVAPEVEIELKAHHGDEFSRFKLLYDFKQHISQPRRLTGYPLEKLFEELRKIGVQPSVQLEPLHFPHTRCGDWSIVPVEKESRAEQVRYDSAYLAGSGEAIARLQGGEYELKLEFAEHKPAVVRVYEKESSDSPVLILRSPTPLSFSLLRQNFTALLQALKLRVNETLDATELASDLVPATSGGFRVVYASNLLVSPDTHLVVSVGPGEERKQTIKRVHVVNGGMLTLENDRHYSDEESTTKTLISELTSEIAGAVKFDKISAIFEDCHLWGEIEGPPGALRDGKFNRSQFGRSHQLHAILLGESESTIELARRLTSCKLRNHPLRGGYSLVIGK